MKINFKVKGTLRPDGNRATGSKKIPITLLVGDNLHFAISKAISEKTEVLWLLVVIFPHSHDLDGGEPR